MIAAPLLPGDRDLLVELLHLDTAGYLETGAATTQMWAAQHRYAEAAAGIGLRTVHHAPARPDQVARDDVPLPVRQALAGVDGFLDGQPNLVLRLGAAAARHATVMFNVHLDTVSGLEPVSFDGSRFAGRGAVDAKGPAVALLAGVRAAVAAEPAVATAMGTLIQVVSGEEGGAMGTIGTRPLVELGHVGRLNVFCEPTALRYLPRATAAATARIRVTGRDAIDDCPGAGHNATVLLGFLAQYLGAALDGKGGQVCVAGLRTGAKHNRVYGTGELLLNLAYSCTADGRRLEAALADALDAGLHEFADRFIDLPSFALTAADAVAITRLDWLKRGLPTLANADAYGEALLAGAGFTPEVRRSRSGEAVLFPGPKAPGREVDSPEVRRSRSGRPWERGFSCDAIWMDGVEGAFTAVCGPGDLVRNNAHAQGEFVDLAELERFASGVAGVLVEFAADRRRAGTARQEGTT